MYLQRNHNIQKEFWRKNINMKVGLALGSGSSRGWAHIGAIEALEEENIPIDFITGCSIGAYVGAIYASGDLNSLKDFVLKMDGKKVFSYFDVVFPQSGFLNGSKKLKELYSMHARAKTFDDLKIPLKMVATNLETGKKVVLDSGNIIDALRATMSMPGLFAPARLNDHWLIDGGLVDPVPTSVARAMGADIVIAIDLNAGLVSRGMKKKEVSEKLKPAPIEEKQYFLKHLSKNFGTYEIAFKNKFTKWFDKDSSTPHIMDVINAAIGIAQERITSINHAVDPPDVLVQPRLADLKLMDFDRVEHAIKEGYLRIKENMDTIKMLIGK